MTQCTVSRFLTFRRCLQLDFVVQPGQLADILTMYNKTQISSMLKMGLLTRAADKASEVADPWILCNKVCCDCQLSELYIINHEQGPTRYLYE